MTDGTLRSSRLELHSMTDESDQKVVSRVTWPDHPQLGMSATSDLLPDGVTFVPTLTASDVFIRDPLTAPGVPAELSERERAIATARLIVEGPSRWCDGVVGLARQFLRAVGVSERG